MGLTTGLRGAHEAGEARKRRILLERLVRPQWAAHGDWEFRSRLRGHWPADSCGTTEIGLNDQAVERGDDKNIETTQAVVAMDHG